MVSAKEKERGFLALTMTTPSFPFPPILRLSKSLHDLNFARQSRQCKQLRVRLLSRFQTAQNSTSNRCSYRQKVPYTVVVLVPIFDLENGNTNLHIQKTQKSSISAYSVMCNTVMQFCHISGKSKICRIIYISDFAAVASVGGAGGVL